MSTAERMQRRRDDIIDAAGRVFAEKGYHDAGIADIASDLGMGHGTFYRYFKNKRDIAAAVLERVLQRVAEPALAEDPEASDTLEEYHAQVQRIVGGMFALIDDHPQTMRFFHGQSLVVDSERMAAALDGYSAFSARFLENGVRKGFLRPDLDVEITAQVLVGMIFEGTRRALRAPEAREVHRRWADAGVALMFDGIAARH
jgi:AcrR family transcriptional regulator